MRACALDVTIEHGIALQLLLAYARVVQRWLEQRLRPLVIEVPPLEELPHHPADLMDRLAQMALQAIERPVKTGAWQIPERRHARPYHDWPDLCGGQVFFHTRARLAHGLFAYPQYQQWVLGELQAEARRGMDVLKERFRRYAPDRSDEELEGVARLSEEGRENPRPGRGAVGGRPAALPVGLAGRHPGAELFVGAGSARADRARNCPGRAEAAEDSSSEWSALRKMFFVPSYSRVLTLLTPVHDLSGTASATGVWCCPGRAGSGKRIKGWKNRVEYSDLPLDLVPDRPMALEALRRSVRAGPELCGHLRGQGYRVESIEVRTAGPAVEAEPGARLSPGPGAPVACRR